jgi:TonB-linked SusC/RagA family outer membrane protein
MRKFLLMMLCFSIGIAQVWAQQRTINGKVSDEAGKPVSDASVVVKGSRSGTVTADDGSFSLSVPANAKTLVISAVGIVSKEIAISSAASYNVTVSVSNNNLDEVVVTGYTREKKGRFAGAVNTISAKVIENTPQGSFTQALQGVIPGAIVNSGSGQPGSNASITIRGVQSISGAGAQPLYILDGVPISSADFQTLNANDFESFNILKDASAAAMYGARAGTGVIVITTKKGSRGQSVVQVRSQVGVTKSPDFSRLDLMNTKEILGYENFIGSFLYTPGGATNNPNTPGWMYATNHPLYAGLSDAQKTRNGFLLDSLGKINTDWSKILYRQGISQSHEVNLSGGSDKTRFFLSAGYYDQEGIDLGSALKRYTTRFNIEHKTGNLTVNWNTGLGYSQTNYSEGEAYGNSARNAFQMTYRAKPYENPYDANGNLIFGVSNTLALKQVGNLLEGIENSSLTQKQIKITTALNLNYEILPGLNIRNNFGIDVGTDLWQRHIIADSYIGSLQINGNKGLNIEGTRYNTQIVNTSSLNYLKKINSNHEFEVGAYFEVIRGYQKALAFTSYNLDPRLTFTSQGQGPLEVGTGQTTYTQAGSSAKSGFGIRSYFATGRYTYADKITVTGAIRRDGTSRIANTANNEITSWSAGAIWNVLRESFMKNQNILTDLNLRASYGVVPNIGSIPTSSYNFLGTNAGTWIGVTNYTGPQLPGFGTTTYAGSSVTGQAPSSPGNPNLKIENIQKANLGIDFALWKNRARFGVDLYRNMTVDLFVSQPLSATTGFANTNINAGKMSNKGVEIVANVDVVKTRDLTLTLGINHAINVNKIEDLGLVDEYFLGTFVIRKGLPYGSHYTYNYLGANPADGRPMYYAADGKTVVYDVSQAGQFADFGTYLPKHVGGFNLNVRWKGISLYALFSYQFDVVRSNNIRNWTTTGTSGYQGGAVNGSRELLTNQWQKPGDVKFFQSPAYTRGFTNSDLENAKFLRFRNLNLAYDLPVSVLKSTKVLKGVRVYGQVQNLAVWSKWTGLDPEDNNNISLNEYPNPTMLVGGIEIKF